MGFLEEMVCVPSPRMSGVEITEISVHYHKSTATKCTLDLTAEKRTKIFH